MMLRTVLSGVATRRALQRTLQGPMGSQTRQSGRRWLSNAPGAKGSEKGPKKVEMGTFERSNVEHRPKLVVGILAFGVATGAISHIMFYEAVRPTCAPSGSPSDSVMFVEEPVTKTKFPLTLSGYESSNSTHWLVASTVRCMLNMCMIERARAYSYAIYLSSDATLACKDCETITDITAKLLPKKPCELEALKYKSDPEFAGQVAEEPTFIPATSFSGAKPGYVFKLDNENGGLGYHKDDAQTLYLTSEAEGSYPSLVLRMVMMRDVEGQHIAHGFDRTLLGRIREAQGNSKSGKGKRALRQLNQMITRKQNLSKGDILEFVRLPDGFVDVRVNGRRELALQSEALSWALFDAYLGPKGHMSTVSKDELISRTQEVASILE